jgi:DNA polymerase-4
MKPRNSSYESEVDVHRITLYSTVYTEHQFKGRKDRLYAHFDFACFYAQVEQLRRNLYGLPLIVGGWRKDNGQVKGIVATSSYEARKQGIKTGMSAFEAYRRCPYVCMVQVDYDTYSAISKQVHHIMRDFSHEVERYSMDEFFLNLTFMKQQGKDAIEKQMQRMQNQIFETTGLVGSVGVSYSKTYAKLASSLHKPKGISIVLDEADARKHIYPLKADKVWGIGRKRYIRITNEGFDTIGDVVDKASEATFARIFGSHFGPMLHTNITGRDQGRILYENDHYKPKHGVSYGHTFSVGSKDWDRIKGEFALAVQQVAYRMRAYGIRAADFGGYIGFNRPQEPGIGFRFTTLANTNVDDMIYPNCIAAIRPMISGAIRAGREIRNLVFWCGNLDHSSQLNLFYQEESKYSQKYKAVDAIRNRFGHDMITIASAMHRVKGQTHFLERTG